MMSDDWLDCSLDDVLTRMSNGSSAKQFNENLGFPISRIETIWNETIDLSRVKYIKESNEDIIEKYGLLKNDILFSHINSNSHLGKTAIFKNQTTVLIHGINLLLLRPSKLINADFLLFQLRYIKVKGGFINAAQQAVNQSSINQRKLKTFEVNLPPLAIQRAIVSKIEALFSELDKGIANFKTAQEQLKIYRQAVLKKAFEGELTNAWREKKSNLPTAEELLKQIKEERQNHYNQQIEVWKKAVKEWEKKGKEGKKPVKPKAEKKFELYDSDIKLFELPTFWKWVNLGEITSVSGGLTKNAKRAILDIKKPFLRVANVYFNRLDLAEMHLIGIKEEELPRVSLKYGDLLLVEGNGSVKQIGRVSIWREEVKGCIHQNHLIKARPFSVVSPEFLLYYLCSKLGRDLIIQVASSTSGLYTLNLTKIYNLKAPICSLEEQHQIVQEIEFRLSVCDRVEQSLSESLATAKALRQSILKKAFEGKLLSKAEIELCKQEKDYEPASELLKKIKAEKLAKELELKKKSSKKRTDFKSKKMEKSK